MKYVSLLLIGFLLLSLAFDTYRQIKKDRKFIWQNLKVSFLGILIAIILIDSIYKR